MKPTWTKTQLAKVIMMSTLALVLLLSSNAVSGAPTKNTPEKVRLEIYSDYSCTNKITQINWGNINAGSNATKMVYIKNVGTTSIDLSLEVTNWNITSNLSSQIACTWDKENTVLAPKQVIKADITLAVPAGISSLSFSMTIQVIGYPK